MILKTHHLLLQILNTETLTKYKKDLVDLNADEDVRRYYPTGTATEIQTMERMQEFVNLYENQRIPSFIVLDQSGTNFYGRCGFGLLPDGHIEVGYVLHKKFWGKGYATEILKTLLSWAQENLDVPQIIGYAPIDHKASQRVMEKCGMTYFKTEKDPIYGTVCAFYQYVKSL
jgi:ribosomal-protein-alanine N-acetyltransferase